MLFSTQDTEVNYWASNQLGYNVSVYNTRIGTATTDPAVEPNTALNLARICATETGWRAIVSDSMKLTEGRTILF
jgi:hypothetical protein